MITTHQWSESWISIYIYIYRWIVTVLVCSLQQLKSLFKRRRAPQPALYNNRLMYADVWLQFCRIHCRIKQDGLEEQGEVVVRGVIERMEGGLIAFEKLWRQHFLDSMRPRYMPAFWSVDHSHDHLRVLENSVLSRTSSWLTSGGDWSGLVHSVVSRFFSKRHSSCTVRCLISFSTRKLLRTSLRVSRDFQSLTWGV